ncbi:hypothetical protein, partial [Bacillus pumilus]|uniref:hypothetical protein n=1 Tax=Bacillus pumilus TaxID=1408 RepID=UPI001121774C
MTKGEIALCLLFSVIENLCSSRKDEHRSADLTTNARVCLHAETVTIPQAVFFTFIRLFADSDVNTWLFRYR